MLSRRNVFQGTIAVAAAAVAGCDRITRLAHLDDPMAALKGKIVLKGSDDYEAVRQAGVWNARKPNRFPNAVVLAENETDVIQAVRLAKQKGWKVGTRSGGHSWAGTHTRDGAILINLAKFHEIKISPEQRIAAVSPSTQGHALNEILRDKHSLMFPSAHGYGIGVGGFVLHGGHGFNSLTVGLGCENLVAIDVVTAQGELIHADETHNSDYLWAARGSGPGFFGVVTRMYLRLHPRPKMQRLANYSFHESEFEPALRWVGEKMDSFPSFLELWAVGRRVKGQAQLDFLTMVHADSEADLQVVRDLLATCPVMPKAFGVVPLVPAVFPPATDDNMQPTGARYVVDGAWSNADADQVIPPLMKAIKAIPTDLSFVFWAPFTPVRKLPDMAYSVRGRAYLTASAASFDASDDQRCEQWVEGFTKDVQPLSLGGQFNDDNGIMNRQYGIKSHYLSDAAAQRMQVLLAKYDPQQMFGYIVPPNG